MRSKVSPTEVDPRTVSREIPDPVEVDPECLQRRKSTVGGIYDEMIIVEGGLTESKPEQTGHEGVREHGLSMMVTLINFAKGMVGPGSLSLPLAFKRAGLWSGLFLVLVFGFLNNFCMHQIIYCAQHLSRKKRISAMSYGDVAYESCANSFESVRRYKHLARLAVNVAVISLQMGISSAFYVFMATQLKEVFDSRTAWHFSVEAWMWMILLPLILINFARTLRSIAIFSTIGNVLMAISFVFVLQHLIRAKHMTWELPWITDFGGVMTASGAILYSYEGQAMILPMENKLRRSSDMVGCCGVLTTGMLMVTALYATTGFFGYITYGPAVKGSVTLNLPSTTLFVIMKIMLVLVLYFGFVIQQYVIVDMLWPTLERKLTGWCLANRKQLLLPIELLFRAFLVLISMLVAMAIPNLEHIIPLVGITSGMLLAFIYPALMDSAIFLPELIAAEGGAGNRWRMGWKIFQNGSLVFIGVFGLVAGLQSSIKSMLGYET